METPDTRLVALHAENGSPHARLSSALAALERADWGLMLHGEAGLARQLSALVGAGTLRIDPRIGLSRDIFAAYGLALATIDADWRGARAVWLLEPTERDVKRAERSDVPIIADSTLAPGGGWLSQGAQYLVYRDGATLSGFGDLELSALFGVGKAPVRAAPAPSDLSLAMVLRDLATLPLRLARASRTTEQLAEQFGGAAQAAGPTALLLAPDSAADTLAPLGGVLAAARAVPAGTLLTPGVQSVSAARALLRQDMPARDKREDDTARPDPRAERRNRDPREFNREPARPDQNRPDNKPRPPQHNQPEQRGNRDQFPRDQSSREQRPRDQFPREQREEARPEAKPAEAKSAETRPVAEKPSEVATPLDYTPEIVFSDSLTQHAPTAGSADLTQISPVSSGPDEPDELPPLENAEEHIAAALHTQETVQEPAPQPEQGQPEQQEPSKPQEPDLNLPPDLPEAGAGELLSGLDEQQQRLYARLRDWRNAEAKRLEVSRFIVASNATLAEIVRQLPHTEEELRRVRGMGPERMRKYGAAILDTINRD